MADLGSDSFSDLEFPFTEEDFAKIDAAIASQIAEDKESHDASFQSEIYGLNLNLLTAEELAQLDTVGVETDTGCQHEIETANSSFHYADGDLNLGTLNAIELASLDAAIAEANVNPQAGPSIEVEIENPQESSDSAALPTLQQKRPSIKVSKPQKRKTPLQEFRSRVPLSVSDLVHPSWCEVQFAYGLRGKRSRPVSERPKSFVSSSGKKISPTVEVAKKNEVRTKQGLVVHKELEREIKFEELKVKITSNETRWALRIVNMLACLKSILDGFTREMPVFGLIHGEVVVGIMDEVVKIQAQPPSHNATPRSPKRPSSEPYSNANAKRIRTEPPQTRIDSFFPSPTKSQGRGASPPTNSTPSPEALPAPITLRIKDNKTRKSPYLPSHPDTFSGRMQLMVYRRLLSELVATNPPYDFKPLWTKLGLDSSAIFPTQFLVQAQLIRHTTPEFETTCLDDLVRSWHKLVQQSNIQGVDPHLELIYRLRPPPDVKKKGKAVEITQPEVGNDSDDEELAKAIAASLEDVSAGNLASAPGPSKHFQSHSLATDKNIEHASTDMDPLSPSQPAVPVSGLEDVQLQWALQQSILPQVAAPGPSDTAGPSSINRRQHDRKGKASVADLGQEQEGGIHRYRIIGTKRFRYLDSDLESHLTHVLQWWRGEREPEGVPLDHVSRCSTCEYSEDCEWRAAKALEFSTLRKR